MKLTTALVVAGVLCTAGAGIYLWLGQMPSNSLTEDQPVTANSQPGLLDVTAPAPPSAGGSISSREIKEKNPPTLSGDLEARYNRLDRNDYYPTLASRIDAMSRRRPDQKFSDDEIMEALEAESAWEATENAPDILNLSEDEINDGREFIKFNATKIETLMEGDSFDFPIEQLGKTFQVSIESVVEDGSNSLSWHGMIENGAEDAFVSITQSENITIAGIHTPDGHFVMQAQNGVGWIASSTTLFKVDPNQSDSMIPPGHSEEGHEHE